MNGEIVRLTVRQLLGKRRTLFLGLFALLPAGLAIAFRVSGGDDPERWTATTLLAGVIVAVVLPLAGLVFGTSALGSEIEDGTAVYILATPVARRDILLAKLAVAWAATTGFVVVSAVIASLISIEGGQDGWRIILGFAAGGAVGSLAYCAVFVLLSVMTSRAFVIGLIYVFIWEGIVTGLFKGTRILSIRQCTLGLSGFFGDLDPRIYEPDLGGPTAAVVAVVAIVGASWLAIRRIKRFEVGESG